MLQRATTARGDCVFAEIGKSICSRFQVLHVEILSVPKPEQLVDRWPEGSALKFMDIQAGIKP